MLTPPLGLSDGDMELIAYDISETLAQAEWPGIDVSSEDILPYLAEFLTKVVDHANTVETL